MNFELFLVRTYDVDGLELLNQLVFQVFFVILTHLGYFDLI